MKKIFKTMLAVAIAAFTFTSCEDVPEPYELPGSGTETPDVPTEEGTYFSEAFATNFGSFTVKTSKGQDWIIDFSTAKASGYVNKTNIESESYLISPAINLTNSQGAYLEFEYILAYTNNAGDVKVLITDNFNDANPESSTWEDITGGLKEPNQKDGKIDWNTFHKYSKNIPTKYIGKNNVRIAFYYNATATGSKTWEIKNAALKEGVVEDDEEVVPEEPENPEVPETPTEGNLIVNGNFETWTGSTADNWNGAAGNGTLSQSTDAHSGNYSIRLAGTSSNKRISYKAITLSAGTYHIAFYAKGEKKNAKLAPGFVAVINGVVDSQNYKYIETYPEVGNEWTLVNHSFTLEENTTLCLVIMNHKSTAANVLIDDYSLTTTDGCLLDNENNDSENDQEETPVANSYSKVTSIVDGTYVFAANTSGTSYVIAKSLETTKNYGYLSVSDGTEENGYISATVDNEFTFKAVDGGYTIQDNNGRYYYMKDSYNSFNVDANMPSSGAVWDVSFNSDGTVNITNIEKGKTIQYSSQYTSFGAYPDISNQMPTLFKK